MLAPEWRPGREVKASCSECSFQSAPTPWTKCPTTYRFPSPKCHSTNNLKYDFRDRTTISAYESVRAGHPTSGLWYERGSCSRLSYVDIVCLVKQSQKGWSACPKVSPSHDPWAVMRCNRCWLESWIRILEVYRRSSVLWYWRVGWDSLIAFGTLHVI